MVVNTVVVTKYDEYDNITLSVDVADSVAAIFESFGIGHNPSTDRVKGRIKKTKLETATRSWRHSEAGSVVYWLGHGRGPDPSRLLDSKSVSNRPNDGIGADDLIDDICRIGQESEFIIIILEACRIREFVQDLKKGLEERPNFNCATLILYSSERVTIPHDVLTELRQILDDVFGAEPEFYLAKLWAEFVIKSKEMSVASESLNISDEVLRRTAPVP
ncbi:MAG: repeat protein, partial [Cryobacterium sp.]|nr:repeat protein [Cryobacterium sp.]